MTRSKEILRAILVGALGGILLGCIAILAFRNMPTIANQGNSSPPSTQDSLTLAPPITQTPILIPSTLPKTSTAIFSTRTPTRVPRTATVSADVIAIQPTVLLRGIKHDYQRWNNCGPTTLEMNLSFWGYTDTQAEIAAFTKPNPDDRNVRPDELAAYAQQVGLRAVSGVNGTLDRLKVLLSNGIPVIVETALVKEPQGWMGHYRLLNGYDAKQFSTYDSYDGPNLKISFEDLDAEWRAFNRLYLIVYPVDLEKRVRAIVPEAFDQPMMYANAVMRARKEIETNSQDAFAQFNLGSGLVGLKRYAEAASAFDRARAIGLPARMVWYQFGPYEAYLQTGRYDDVIALADSLVSSTDDLEEAHYYKGLALRALKREQDARREFETALKYNKNYQDAQRALEAR